MNILASTVCDESRTALAQSFIACSLFRTGTGKEDDDDDDDGENDDGGEDPDSVAFVIIPVNELKKACATLLSVLVAVVVVVVSASAPAPTFGSVATVSAFAPSFGSAPSGGGALR
jgi:hypothetical protein